LPPIRKQSSCIGARYYLNGFLNGTTIQVHLAQSINRKLAVIPMNAMTNPARTAGTLIGDPSFADAMAAIERAEDLGPEQKRHWLTSLRQMERYLDRPLSLIPTRIAAITEAVNKLHPTRLGVNPKTFINHRAKLLWFNKQTPYSGRKAPMDICYRALLDRVEDRYAKDVFSPFFRFLSALAIQLEDIRDSHAEAFQTYRRETSFGRLRSLVRLWNDCAKQIAEWPQITLTEPPYAKSSAGPALQEFPRGLWDGIDAYCERISKRHKTTSGRISRPCKSSTIELGGGSSSPP
jgi:hypothetical protein